MDGFRGELDVLVRAGIAAPAKAALGCGARITCCLAPLMAGRVSLASIWMGFRSGLGSGLGTLILGASNFISGIFGGSSMGGGGGILTLGGGGGSLAGRISIVSSYLC